MAGQVLVPSLWTLLALSLVALPAPAQQADSQAVRVAAAEFITRRLPTMQSFGERSAVRVLAATPLRYGLGEGKMVMLPAQPPRPIRDAEELARVLLATVATQADSVWCAPLGGPCHGTTGVQIRLSDPVIRGDSATVLYALQMLRPVNGVYSSIVTVWYALYLVWEQGRWRTGAFGVANLEYLAPPHEIGPDGMPVIRPSTTGGGGW